MFDEFQQRYLTLLQNSPYIKSVARDGKTIVNIQYYCYNVQIGSIAAPLLLNVPQQNTIETQADSDFAISYMSGSVRNAAADNVLYTANVTLQLQDTATGKLFFNQPAMFPLVSGAGGFPYVLPAPRVINPNSTVLCTAMNRDTTQNFTGLFLALHGTRIFYQ
jgi:hypothetical protein